MRFIAVRAGIITDFQSWGMGNGERGMGNGEWGMEKTYFFKSVNKLMTKRYSLAVGISLEPDSGTIASVLIQMNTAVINHSPCADDS